MATFIDYIPRITLSNLKELIKRQSETDATLCARFTLKGIQYTAVVFLNKNEMLFYWDYEASRYAFCHVYSYQNESRINRLLSSFGKNDSPERKYGKKTYKGKVTPYGKRVSKYYSKLHRFNVMLENWMLPRKQLEIKLKE